MKNFLIRVMIPLILLGTLAYKFSPVSERVSYMVGAPQYVLSGTLERKGLNTFDIDGKRILIVGVGFPRADQTCIQDTEHPMFSCLERSTEMTTEYLPETPVRCDVLFELGSDKVGIANCFDGDINIGAELIKRGIAYAERRFAGGIYLPEEYLARVKEVGLWSNYHMHPEDHRVQRQEAEMRYRATRHLGSNGPKIIEHFRKKYETDGGLIKPQDE